MGLKGLFKGLTGGSGSSKQPPDGPKIGLDEAVRRTMAAEEAECQRNIREGKAWDAKQEQKRQDAGVVAVDLEKPGPVERMAQNHQPIREQLTQQRGVERNVQQEIAEGKRSTDQTFARLPASNLTEGSRALIKSVLFPQTCATD
jgi:hypothetical protein